MRTRAAPREKAVTSIRCPPLPRHNLLGDTMLKLICVSFSTLVLTIAAVAGAQSYPAASGAATASTSSCQAARLACKADCGDLGGGALGACLRACDVEYRECLSGHPS